MSIQFSPCDLHFPHKEWSDNWQERENYLAIERWAMHFRKNCGGTVLPPPTPMAAVADPEKS